MNSLVSGHLRALKSAALMACLALAAACAQTPGATEPAPVPPTTEHCGSIWTHETWAANTEHILTCNVTVQQNYSLTIEPGAVVKGANSKATLRVDGTLNANGTPAAPVTFTSIHDNSVGVSVSNVSPSNKDWQGINASGGNAVLHLDNVVIRYANIGVDVTSGKDLRVNGSITDVGQYGVRSPQQMIDARNVDWGSASGPAPGGTGSAVNGMGVVFLPYAGFNTPTYDPSRYTKQAAPNNTTCTDIEILGLRGSNETPRLSNNDPYGTVSVNSDSAAAGWVAEQANATLTSYLNSKRPGTTTKLVGINYPALMFSELDEYPNPDFLRSMYGGAFKLQNYLIDESARCPQTRFVVAAYSQGSAATRMALNLMAGQPALDKVQGVIFVGDPSKGVQAPETVWKGSQDVAKPGTTSYDRAGYIAALSPTYFAPLQPAMAARTISICHILDQYCATGPGAAFFDHIWYQGYEIDTAMKELAPGIVSSLNG
jgi:hypothetical protein